MIYLQKVGSCVKQSCVLFALFYKIKPSSSVSSVHNIGHEKALLWWSMGKCAQFGCRGRCFFNQHFSEQKKISCQTSLMV